VKLDPGANKGNAFHFGLKIGCDMHHISSKAKGKHKQGESSSSWAGTVRHVCFIYTCTFEFVDMFYLIHDMFLFAGHNGLSALTGASYLGCCMVRSSTRLPSSKWLERPSCRLLWTRSPRGSRCPRGGSRGAGGVLIQG
jgi:hypothetical protein